MKFQLYPLTVRPILKKKVWGGSSLSAFMNVKKAKIGEVWMFADQKENNSIISNGYLKGLTIGAAIRKYPLQLLGAKLISKYGKKFPLLFKYLDVNDKLSVQVHPDDAAAKSKGYSAGKTEMWYILSNTLKSKLYIGFKNKQTKKSVSHAIADNTILDKLKKYNTNKSDCYFIPAGTVHTIGKGNMIFEMQQNSDITYRIYDWGRKNINEDRRLNISDAVKSIKFDSSAGKIRTKAKLLSHGLYLRKLIDCEYFKSEELIVKNKATICDNLNMARVITIIEGKIEIEITANKKYSYSRGDIVFIPFGLSELAITLYNNSRVIYTEII